MQLYQRAMLSVLAVFAIMLTFTSTGLANAKPLSCCKSVSTMTFEEPILRYTFQKANPPCVNAIVFETSKGVQCSAPNAPWVRKAIKKVRMAKQQP
ncbi:C-C motif chemokine 4-like [Clupea harengus]|uniref:C-C motif chemokine 4-like n=1 Tax=Clupea harengus TaxID=7950 RepID=A0A6P8EVR4_CLUHA|nr:C-C motif chemokine 4-like [Clupea harengus]